MVWLRDSMFGDFLTTIKKPMCVAPWTSMTIAANGEVKIDIVNGAVIGHIDQLTPDKLRNNDTLKEIMYYHLNQRWHHSCHRCKTKESMVGKSRRTFFENQSGIDLVQSDFSAHQPKIKYLDINSSNKCNLKCTMCNGKVSTGWIKDEQKLQAIDQKYNRPKDCSYVSWDPDHLISLFANSDIFDDLQYLALRGGEPLYEPKNFKILDWLITSGHAQNLILDVSTNGTMLDENFYGYCKKFKRVDLYVSIEAVGDLYQYIRGGQTITAGQLLRTCAEYSTIDTVRLCFAVTISAQNVLHMSDLWNGLSQYSKDAEFAFNNVVVNPSYLNFNVLPQSIKDLASDRIKQSGIPTRIRSKHVEEYDSGITALLDGLANPIWSEDQRQSEWSKFVSFTLDLDAIRNTDYFSIVPELRDHL